VLRQEQPYASKWEQFTRLGHTQDSLAAERRGLRRWLLMPVVAFVIPVDDTAVIVQLTRWQNALRPWLPYDPQPAERLHITLHYAGGMRQRLWRWIPYSWNRAALPALAERVRPILTDVSCFEIRVGPLNTFPNALIAEVQDDRECLRALRTRLRRALPLRARPPMPWPFLPHVTLGYWGKQPTAPLVNMIRPFREAEPVKLDIKRVLLTVYTRDATPPHSDVLRTAQEEVVAEFTLGRE
jgi:2'-5' RNA ligase